MSFSQATLWSGSGSGPRSLRLLPPDDLGPPLQSNPQSLSHHLDKLPLPPPESLIQSQDTGSLTTDCSHSESESSTAILAELQMGSSNTSDRSEMPSPAWGQRSAVTDGTTLATPAATHVILLLSFASISFYKELNC